MKPISIELVVVVALVNQVRIHLFFSYSNIIFLPLVPGYTFNLIGSEKDFNIMKEIEKYFSHPIDEITIEGIAQLEDVQD